MKLAELELKTKGYIKESCFGEIFSDNDHEYHCSQCGTTEFVIAEINNVNDLIEMALWTV